jgi:uncharacterized protein YjiS (DUF1127 family)
MLTNSRSGLRAIARSLPHLPSPVQLLVRIADVVGAWERRARERKTLSEMPDQLLKDIGISRVMIARRPGLS